MIAHDLSILHPSNEPIYRLAEQTFGRRPTDCIPAGEGFYARVFHLTFAWEPGDAIAKVYKYTGLATREQTQLTLLRGHSLLPMPMTWGVHLPGDDSPLETLWMEYIPGVNAGNLMIPDEEERRRFAEQMVENLIALHSVTNPAGFSEIDGTAPTPEWTDFLRPRIFAFYRALEQAHFTPLSPAVRSVIDRSLHGFDSIFAGPVSRPALIHSDYNLWNILVAPGTSRILAVIDPLDAGWADREMDLFHLQNAGGDRFGLLDRYRGEAGVSPLFEVKNAFYRFWDDIKHLVNVGWYEEAHFLHYGSRLTEEMDRLGI